LNGTTEDFDGIIVGAGQAGPPLAARLAGAGQRVAIVERHLIGGTCLNVGCTPTKTMVASAYAAHMARRAPDFGVTASGPVAVDIKTVRRRVEGVVAHKVFLDVGGRAAAPPWLGLDDVPWLSSTDMLSLGEIPRHLVVIGGGYVGLEFAQMQRRFGADVTVVEMGPALVRREDLVVSAEIQAILQDEGIAVQTRTECIRVAPHAEGVTVTVDCESGDREIVASHVLLAVGRRPNTDDLGLGAAGIKTDGRGYVVVDDWLRTSAAGVWALGDCNGRGAFTHTSYGDADMVSANLLDGENKSLRDRVSAYALYIDPPLGRAGITETEARAAGYRVRVGERRMDRVSRAIEKDEATRGLMRLVVDADDDKILGAAILGPGGDEAISSIVMAIGCRAKAADLRRVTGIHPTVAEFLRTLAGELGPVLEATTAAP
jgi:pyruvate/2-oxoglutarate dehydrogenase complex dihydrolipoamide dehydrogenase (E3) component